MTSPEWERLSTLLERALALPIEERAAFVDRETGDHPDLRKELLQLIAASDGADEYMDSLQSGLFGEGVRGALDDLLSEPDATDPWIGREVAHYRILARVGGGGMGVVYRAHDVQLDRSVALKFLAPEIGRDDEAKRRFLQEARSASALDHPNICTIHDIGETPEGRLYIVMALYEGETLRARIARGRVSEDEALGITRAIASALAVAHERGVVHRDVKPANVFLTHDGGVKLLDFGLARAEGETTTPGAVRGTLAYMSPEQARGEPTDERTDVWSSGVVLFEMLTGERPFQAEGREATIQAILTRSIPRPERTDGGTPVSAATGALLDAMLARDPADRLSDGAHLLARLPDARGPAPSATERPMGGRLRWAVAAAAVLGLAAWGLSQRSPGPAGGATGNPAVAAVLWVDDNPENNAEQMLRLRENGVEVIAARSTAEAIETFARDPSMLVISDMGRFEGPEDSFVARAGLELLERLRDINPDVAFAVCTSPRGAATYRDSILALGAIDIFTECDRVFPLAGL